MSFKLDKLQMQILDLLGSGLSKREARLQTHLTEAEFTRIWSGIEEIFETSTAKSSVDHFLLATYHRIERRQLEAELWASEARLTALMDTYPDAIFLIEGRSGRILKANNAASLILGYTPRELIGATMELLVPEELREKHVGLRNGFLNSIRKREMGYHPVIPVLKKDGSILDLDIALTAAASTDDVMAVCRLGSRDVSESKATKRRSNGN